MLIKVKAAKPRPIAKTICSGFLWPSLLAKKPKEKNPGIAKNVAMLDRTEVDEAKFPNAAIPEIINRPATIGTSFKNFFLFVFVKNAKTNAAIDNKEETRKSTSLIFAKLNATNARTSIIRNTTIVLYL